MEAPFIDRRVELGVLEREWSRPGPRLVIVYGRRRVGKTRLILEWLKRHRGAYYEAAELGYEQLAREFAESMGRQLGLYVPGDDVVKAIEAIASQGTRLAIVIDEFQYLVQADPTLPSRLMRSIDTSLSKSNIVLVLSGSAVSFFEKELLGYRAPLHGRRTAQLRLRPLRLLEAWGFWPQMDPIEALQAYSVVGGTPAYLAKVYRAQRLREVLEQVVEPGSPFLEEAPSLLRQELREPRSYAALLKAIAEGSTRPSEAAQRAGIDPRSVHRYIEVLEELDIVRRVRPLGYKRGQRIHIIDPYFRFYYGFLIRVKSLVELGIIPSFPQEKGPWWHRGDEIDLVVRSPGESTTFIEAKWRTLDLREARGVLAELERKSVKTGLASAKNYYVVIAKKVRGISNPFERLDDSRIVADYSRIMEVLRQKKA